MVERRVCTFCGHEIEPGTGRMYVRKDGVVYQFCTSKCYKNMIELKRVPRRTTWTTWHAREKETRMKVAEPEPAPKKARKVRKGSEGDSGSKKTDGEKASEAEVEDE
jgi:large subunit ribosomal protein L24e